MQALGIDILNSWCTFKWDNIEIPMIPMGYWKQSHINDSPTWGSDNSGLWEACSILFKKIKQSAKEIYTTMDNKFFSIYKTFREYYCMLFGQNVTVETLQPSTVAIESSINTYILRSLEQSWDTLKEKIMC